MEEEREVGNEGYGLVSRAGQDSLDSGMSMCCRKHPSCGRTLQGGSRLPQVSHLTVASDMLTSGNKGCHNQAWSCFHAAQNDGHWFLPQTQTMCKV